MTRCASMAAPCAPRWWAKGANLGVTQLGRIEYARTGGRIDTDAVDNSAGVDTSDHEVNLKILLSGPARRGDLPPEKRDALLVSMTDDVARLVLKDNYDQTLRCRWRKPRRRLILMPPHGSSPTWRRATSWTARWNSFPPTANCASLRMTAPA